MNQPLPSLERLQAEFERVAHKEPRRRPLRRRALLFAAIAALVISAVALAASGVLTGTPVKNPPGFPEPKPHVALGVVLPRSVTLTSLRVADPGGGPPWGLRTMTTSREQGCIQIGRVVDGRLGVLGQDGAFGNDGRFHELPPDVDLGRDCTLVDGAGRPFIADSVQGLPASGPLSACVVRRPTAEVLGRMPRALARRQAGTPLCPHADMRIVYYGTLGPQAVSVTYKDHGRLRTTSTSGPWGAYLVVVRPDRAHPARGYFMPASSPASGLVAIRYRDGHQCRIRNPRRIAGAIACPRVGYVATSSPSVTPRDLTTAVTASFSLRPQRLKSPGGISDGPKTWVLHIAFTARAAAGPRSFYFAIYRYPPCNNGVGESITSPILRDVRPGDRVATTAYVPLHCHGTITGQVRLNGVSDKPAPAPFTSANPSRAPLVGRFSATIPRR